MLIQRANLGYAKVNKLPRGQPGCELPLRCPRCAGSYTAITCSSARTVKSIHSIAFLAQEDGHSGFQTKNSAHL